MDMASEINQVSTSLADSLDTVTALVDQSLNIQTNTNLTSEDRVTTIVEQLRALPVVQHAFTMLQEQLPDNLWYHDFQHSQEVFETVIALGVEGGRLENELELLAIAAAFHDSGFIEALHGNEPVGARYASDAMKAYGYTENQIRIVTDAILATQMQPVPEKKTLEQRATNELSAYLLDADLANFGKALFAYKTVSVFNEVFGASARSLQDLATPQGVNFLEGTSRLLEHHRWQTEAARRLFDEMKSVNLEIINEVVRLYKVFLATESK